MIDTKMMKHIAWEDDNTSIVQVFFFMDSASDLPNDLYYFSTDTDRYKTAQGSMAYDIATGDMYISQSDGTWVNQTQ